MAAIAAACRKALVNAGWATYRKFSVEKPWSMPFDPQKFSIEKPWSMPGGPFIHYPAQTGIENAPFTFYRQILNSISKKTKNAVTLSVGLTW